MIINLFEEDKVIDHLFTRWSPADFFVRTPHPIVKIPITTYPKGKHGDCKIALDRAARDGFGGVDGDI